MCQDTGTAIVMGKKSEGVLTGADDGVAISRGVYDAYTRLNLRYSQLAPITTWEEKNTGTNLPAQIELYSTPDHDGRPEYKFLFMAKGGGSANKSFLYQETKAVLNPKRMLEFLDEKIRSLGTAACPPYHLAVVIGGTQRGVRPEDREVRQRALPRQPADLRDARRPRVPRPRARGGGLQADAVLRDRCAVRRQVLLPRRARRTTSAARRLLPGRARRLVLGRPPGARQDHRRRGLPRAARDRPGAATCRPRPPPSPGRRPTSCGST